MMLEEKVGPSPNHISRGLPPNGVHIPQVSVPMEPEVEIVVIHVADFDTANGPFEMAAAEPPLIGAAPAASTTDLEEAEPRSPTSVSSRLENESECEEDHKRQSDVLQMSEAVEGMTRKTNNSQIDPSAKEALPAGVVSSRKAKTASKAASSGNAEAAPPVPAAPAAAAAPIPMPPFLTLAFFKVYLSKFLGQHGSAHVLGHRQPLHLLFTFIGATLGIGLLAFLHYNIFQVIDVQSNGVFLIGSFGASATLLYGAPTADFSQPRNVWGGHVVSAISGLIIASIIPDTYINYQTLRAALAVALAIVAMNVTHTVHPPGGATALIAVTPNAVIQDLGWLYLVLPVAVGAAVMILVAVLVNNCTQTRHYPKYWI